MKILDRYIIKQFFQTILFGLLAFILLFVIIDMFEKLDDFIDKDVPKYIIVKYYAVFLPEIVRLILPVSVLLSGLFTVGKMANQNELTAIKAGGTSVYRFMAPFIVISFFISIVSIFFGGNLVPMANKERIYIEQFYMKKNLVNAGSNIFFQDSPSRVVTISFYDVQNEQANQIAVQEFDPQKLQVMISRIDADRMKFDTLSGSWKLISGVQRTFGKFEETAETFDTLKIDYLNFQPEEVIKKQRKPDEMTLNELSNYAIDQYKTGNDPTRILIEYHSRFAFAFASFFVVLFGLPISVNKRKGGLAIQIGIVLLLSFSYLIFMKVSQSFGKNGVLNPLLTAWLANIVYFSAGLINLYRVRK